MFHSQSILKAMHLADQNLKKLIKFSKEFNYNILIISSMGQASIDRGEYIPEIYLKNFDIFIKSLNLLPDNYKLLPAMHPDYCIESNDLESMNKLRCAVSTLKDYSGIQLLAERYEPVGLKINFIFKPSASFVKHKSCFFGKKIYKIAQIGCEFINRDIGTGYHTPDGIFCWWGQDQKLLMKNKVNTPIDTRRICPTILKTYGIKIPQYMIKPLIINK